MAADTKVEDKVTVRLRGSGGAVWEYDLDHVMTNDVLMAQIAQGVLRPADSAAAVTLAGHSVRVGP